MASTDQNLDASFAGESQANRRYTLFARRAEEGLPEIARLFRAAAQSENVHLECQLRALRGVGSTIENLKVAIEGENFEHTEMYPEFIEEAKREGRKEARMCFSFAKAVEERHENLYREALESLESGKGLDTRRHFVCLVCGNLERDAAPDVSPVCGNPREVFTEVE